MTEWPPELGARTVIFHMTNARRLRTQARSELLRRILAANWRYAVAPFAFGRRMCSSSRGNISTKLHGR
jgi:hypothetical protein